ncbi:hypothetical protein DNTS_001966 [Danionella cerebrum]|uniref:Kinesin motor domain-containing protein n=1 Tax=Danionella cerebrum TaxID=2873325 RepID=A0A553PIQ0_9TELE|nr:hypothetical protein DNTS_001966 [Danionella translucida]
MGVGWMMESEIKDHPDTREMILVEDLRRNLSSEFKECSSFQHSSDLEKEHLKVYLRIRPFSAAEVENGESQDCVVIHPPETVLLRAPQCSQSARLSDKSVPVMTQSFQFSKAIYFILYYWLVYGADATQKTVFDGTVSPLVKNVLEGQSSLVFTYGVTNAGKTFTFLGPDADPGILPRSLNMIFSNLEGRIFTQMSLKPQSAFHRRVCLVKARSLILKLLCLLVLDGSTLSDTSSTENLLNSEVEPHTRFSIWVSFCEIYNENIHDLLEQQASNASRRTNLRLCQDIKGDSFIKDLKWVQVSSAEEALKILKVGKRNQSISSTKLNLLSSRSHSIFSVRILRVEDVGTPRVESVSELALCDLAGSERCAKTQNRGERLKEAGNINTSLLSLGKCINALRHNQQARQHVPFRESKLTHYLQGYFTGRGSACMIVNVNQCASTYDETLNVLKFSAVAQKVVFLTMKNVTMMVKSSARDVSFIINNADHPKIRRSSLVRWDPSLEDVQEDSDYEEEEDEESQLDGTMLNTEEGKETVVLDKAVYEGQLQFIEDIRQQLSKEKAKHLTLEERVRDEVTKEFAELISQMQDDYSERISRERELIEERCERRMEILKNLVGKTAIEDYERNSAASKTEQSLDSWFDSMSSDVAEIRQDAEAAQSCLVTSDPSVSAMVTDLEKEVAELSEQLKHAQSQLLLKTLELETQSRLSEELEAVKKALESHRQRESDLSEMCKQKDEMISKLQTNPEQHIESRAQEGISSALSSQKSANRKRRQEPEVLDGQPPLKKGPLEDLSVIEDEEPKGCEDSAHLGVKGQVDCSFAECILKDKKITDLLLECHRLQVCIQDLKSNSEERLSQAHTLKDEHQTFFENKPMTAAVESSLSIAVASRKSCTACVCEELVAAKLHMAKQNRELGEKSKQILTLEKELTLLKQEVENKADYDDLKKMNSDLQAEITNLRKIKAELEEEIGNLQKKKEEVEDQEVGLENLNLLDYKSRGADCQTKLALSGKEVELAKRENALALKEANLSTLQKRLKQAEERLVEQETQAVQEARKKECRRYHNLKDEVKASECKMSNLAVDLRRREDDSSDLREKLSDSKKQIQHVQKEISSMRESEKSLRLKLGDLEKAKSQLQNEITSRDRTINQLRAERSSDSKSDENLLLYQKACKDLQEQERVIEDMRLALTEQEETQTQLDLELENRDNQINDLNQELLMLREMNPEINEYRESKKFSDDCLKARQQLTQAQESLLLATEKHQAERRKWMEEKLVLIAQAKEAEERRNQDMRRFAEDREKHVRQQIEMESLTTRLANREKEMESWRKERDTLVSTLEIQLKKLLSSNAEKDQQIKTLQSISSPVPPSEEVIEASKMEALQTELVVKEAEIQKLKEQLSAPDHSVRRHSSTQTTEAEYIDVKPLNCSTLKQTSRTRGSVTSQSSTGSGPLVLDSSEISTETGRRSRFPQPEMEISFSPLQPDRFALKRQGEDAAVTVKITRPARKRKSGEMEKDGLENENIRNLRTRMVPRLTPHKEEPSNCLETNQRGKKDKALQKIGDFLQRSPTFLGSKAKRIMGLMGGKSPDAGTTSLNLKYKRDKRKFDRPEISSPMDIPAHQIIGRNPEEKESENFIKKRLRTKTAK